MREFKLAKFTDLRDRNYVIERNPAGELLYWVKLSELRPGMIVCGEIGGKVQSKKIGADGTIEIVFKTSYFSTTMDRQVKVVEE